MHITIMALGSRGDVLPCVALGAGLRAAGHQVRFITSENFRAMVDPLGLEFHPIQFDAVALLNSAAGLQMAAAGRNFVKAAVAIFRSFGSLAERYAEDLSTPVLVETDAIINQLPGSLYGIDLAEKANVPYLTAAVIPLVRTRSAPMIAFPDSLSVIPGFNAFSHRFAEQLVWQYFRRSINRWRGKAWGLPPAPFQGPFAELYRRPVPMLNGFSSRVVTRPSDWGEHVHTTGYWFADETTWTPPEPLRRFIEEGPPPVYFGFGSMPLADPDRLLSAIAGALRSHGRRGVLGPGLGGGRAGALPEHLIAANYAPFKWLFPKMAAVFHHGGSGTTAHNVCAGVPGVVVPFLFDQFYWGRRLRELGVGGPMIPFNRLSAEALVESLDRVLNDQDLQARSRTLSAGVRAENGISKAVEVIGRYLEGSNGQPSHPRAGPARPSKQG